MKACLSDLTKRLTPNTVMFLGIALMGLGLLFISFLSLYTEGQCADEAVALISARHWHNVGFLKTFLFPVHNGGDMAFWGFDAYREWLYNRYPPLPDLLVGLLVPLGGTETFLHFRILPLALNLVAIALFYRLVSLVTQKPWLAVFAALAYAWNISFAKMANSFHYMGYAEFARMALMLSMFLAARAHGERQKKQAFKWQLTVITAAFFNVWITFDYILASLVGGGLLILAFAPGLPKSPFRRLWKTFLICIPAGLGTLAAMVLRVIQNGWYAGSIPAALKMFAATLVYRMTGKNPGASASPPADFSWATLGDTVEVRLMDSYDLIWVNFYFILAAAFAVLLVLHRRPENRTWTTRYFVLLAIMLLANSLYSLMLPQWAIHHFGLLGIRHILPVWGLVTGGLLYAALVLAHHSVMDIRAISGLKGKVFQTARLAPVLFLTVVSIYGLGNVLALNAGRVVGAWIHMSPNTWAERFAVFDEVRAHLPPHAYVMGNMMWRNEARYRIDRRAQVVEKLEDLTPTWARDISRFNPETGPTVQSLLKGREIRDGQFEGVPLNEIAADTSLVNAGQAEGYFLFYERWDEPNDGFFPNYYPAEKEQEAQSRALMAWLEANAPKVWEQGKWHLYRIEQLPPAQKIRP